MARQGKQRRIRKFHEEALCLPSRRPLPTLTRNVPAATLDPPSALVPLPSWSETTLHPIHRSMGVSLEASICDRSRAGAEKASFTPSNSPFRAVVVVVFDVAVVDVGTGACCLWGSNANPETVEAVKRRAVHDRMVEFCVVVGGVSVGDSERKGYITLDTTYNY